MAKRKIKKNVKIAALFCGLLVCAAIVFAIIKLNGGLEYSKENHSQSHMIENNGNLDLIIPDDQDTGGF